MWPNGVFLVRDIGQVSVLILLDQLDDTFDCEVLLPIY